MPRDVGSNGSFERLPYRPTSDDAVGEDCVRYASDLAPLFDMAGFAMKSDHAHCPPVRGLVMALLFWRRPATIGGFIVPRRIGVSINRSPLWSRSQISVERFERVEPSLADDDPLVLVTFNIGWFVRIIASLLHTLPNSVLRRGAHVMSRAGFPQCNRTFNLSATTTLVATSAFQIPTSCKGFVSARAVAQPQDILPAFGMVAA